MASGNGLRVSGRAQNNSQPFVGSRPFSTSLGAKPGVVNQTLGFMSNQCIPYHYTIARWQNDLDKNIMNGQLVFLKCNKDTPLLRNRAYTMLNLQMVNYSLYREALARQKANVLNNVNLAEEALQPPEILAEILKTYRPIGSVINSVNGKEDPSNNADRVINCCVSGRQTTFNIWGELHDSDFIGLKLKMFEVKGMNFNLSLSHHSKVQDDLRTLYCYQWVPYRNSTANRWKKPIPNKKALSPEYYYELGRVYRCPRGKDYELDESARLSLCQDLSDMITKTHMFEIQFNVRA